MIRLGPIGKDGKYEYSVVSSRGRGMVWVLARDPNVFREKYEKGVLNFLKRRGYIYFWNQPMMTYQGDDCMH